jgi:hypothetical protein
MFKNKLSKISAAVLSLLITFGVASPAFAAAVSALPYNFTFTYLSGGNGVDTPDIKTTSTGKLCVTTKATTYQDPNSPPTVTSNTVAYTVKIVKTGLIDQTIRTYTFYAGYPNGTYNNDKICATGLVTNYYYKWNIAKVNADGALLKGSGTATYS